MCDAAKSMTAQKPIENPWITEYDSHTVYRFCESINYPLAIDANKKKYRVIASFCLTGGPKFLLLLPKFWRKISTAKLIIYRTHIATVHVFSDSFLLMFFGNQNLERSTLATGEDYRSLGAPKMAQAEIEPLSHVNSLR